MGNVIHSAGPNLEQSADVADSVVDLMTSTVHTTH